MFNKLIKIIQKHPIRSLTVVLVIGCLIYIASDPSFIYSVTQGFKDGYPGK